MTCIIPDRVFVTFRFARLLSMSDREFFQHLQFREHWDELEEEAYQALMALAED